MNKRFVIFRAFAKNKFGNEKEITGGEILGRFTNYEDIARSEFFHTKKAIDNYHKILNSGYKITHTYEEAKQQLYEDMLSLIKGRMESLGHMYNIQTENVYNAEDLLKVNFGNKCEHVSFIVLDLENTNKPHSKLEKKWFREINLINLIN